MSNTGRTQVKPKWAKGCRHEQLEYVDCKNGEITWKCVTPQCFFTDIQYNDTCSGG